MFYVLEDGIPRGELIEYFDTTEYEPYIEGDQFYIKLKFIPEDTFMEFGPSKYSVGGCIFPGCRYGANDDLCSQHQRETLTKTEKQKLFNQRLIDIRKASIASDKFINEFLQKGIDNVPDVIDYIVDLDETSDTPVKFVKVKMIKE